jgi:hypothetical protein
MSKAPLIGPSPPAVLLRGAGTVLYPSSEADLGRYWILFRERSSQNETKLRVVLSTILSVSAAIEV